MNNTIKGLSWAAMIIAAAIVTKESGLSDAAAWGVIAGLMGAFFATNGRGARCGSC